MIHLYDLNKIKIEGLQKYKDYKVESVLSTGDKTLSFLYPSRLSKDIKEECYIRTKKDEFVVKEVSTNGEWNSIKATLNVENLEGQAWEHFDTTEKTIAECLTLAVAGTGWTVQVDNVTKRRTIRKTNCSTWDIIQQAKKTYLVEIEFDTINKVVKVAEKLGSDKGAYFMDSLNLRNLDVQSNSYDFYTRIVAIGKDDLKVTVENYQYSSKKKTLIWKDERYTDINSLTEDATKKLEEISKPYKAYGADIIDLANTSNNYSILSYGLGDTITLISKDKGIKEKQRIVKITEYPEEPHRNSCEIANSMLSFTDIQKEYNDTVDTVNNITIDNGTVDGSSIDSITTEQISDFEVSVGKITDLTAVNARIDNLYAEKVDVGSLNAVEARVGDLETTRATITQLDAANANIVKLQADKADIVDLNASIGRIGILESSFGKIDILESDLAKIDTLVNGQLTSDNIQSLILTSDKITVDNGFIKNAMIENLDVSKINAGDISTNKFKIKSDNGGIEIVGATQQFKDKNSNVRIQMGQDTQGDFNFILKGEDGTTTLIDHTGIKENAIGDDLIKGNMISENAVGGKQIDYNSFTEEFNKDTNTNTLKSSKVLLDGTNQTLNLAFNTLNSTVNGVKSTTESNTTAINVQQGKIETLISNTTITKEDGEVVKLKDEYSITKNTVNEISGKIGAVEQNITDIYIKVETTESSIEQLNNSISLKVSKSEVETTVNNAIDEVEVGGRNLLIGTGTLKTMGGYAGATYEYLNEFMGEKNVVKITNPQNYVYFSPVESYSELNKNINYIFSIRAMYGGENIGSKTAYLSADSGSYKTLNGDLTNTEFNLLSRDVIFTEDSINPRIHFNFKGYDVIYLSMYIKLEKGNKATDWTPAQEDVDKQFDDVYNHISDETQEIIKNYETAIEQKADSITLSVSENYSTKDDNSSLEESLTSLIEQTAEDITFKFDGANGYTTEIDGKLQEFIDKVETYIQFSSEGISLGKINNPFIASLGNTELSFLQDGVKVAYISNNKLYITDAEIRNKLTIGNPTNGYFDYIPRQNGNLSMKWRSS